MPGLANHKMNLKSPPIVPINHKTKTIEIIGPPGIGKSTFYKSLCKTWNNNLNWVYQNRLLAPPKPKLSEFKIWLQYQFHMIANKDGNRDIPVDYGLRFVEDHKELGLFFWNHLSGINSCMDKEIGKSFRSAYFLFKDFCRYQAIFDSISSKPCIIDEGFLQKSFLLQDNEKLMAEIVTEYLHLIPLPSSVIYINTTDANIIIDRICNRKKIIASHFRKDKNELIAETEKWQYLFSIIIEKLTRNNIPVLCIDGERPIDENVRYINSVLS
ncbi:hypothetical protein [Flavisolibacter ginsengisoli]|jgi:hypothetical protein|uniref:Deoxynucleoside kinase domain-containing protein n=1 Tax=Flavisolibacter ginsengisoli DSM 18119 TaxID=1121884 RepID=A0A1M5BA82_9BACT|nr:hypothetical protein [Flavisolibacter ginsengisoli]SHF39316.1 hypothetical protein SAMN02745131_02487 [Flavisolibacter ginsengisoli DSM 18119]